MATIKLSEAPKERETGSPAQCPVMQLQYLAVIAHMLSEDGLSEVSYAAALPAFGLAKLSAPDTSLGTGDSQKGPPPDLVLQMFNGRWQVQGAKKPRRSSMARARICAAGCKIPASTSTSLKNSSLAACQLDRAEGCHILNVS